MDTRPPPSLEEQIEAVRNARDYLDRSAGWRAGRRGFNPHRHARDVACLDAAIATLAGAQKVRDAADKISRSEWTIAARMLLGLKP